MSELTEVDYVIIGGGAGGCVVAARLAAESGGTVALIERGARDRARAIHVPATFPRLFNSRHVDSVVSEPDPSLDGRGHPCAARPRAGGRQLDRGDGLYARAKGGLRCLGR